MLMDSLPIAVMMQKRAVAHPWADAAWSAAAVLVNPGSLTGIRTLAQSADREAYLVPGLSLELYPDENDGYFENWIAPEPKVFVLWRMDGARAMPVAASVSYGEGARMLDSGDPADGVPMPPEIYAWLADYLQKHYQPRPRRGRDHG